MPSTASEPQAGPGPPPPERGAAARAKLPAHAVGEPLVMRDGELVVSPRPRAEWIALVDEAAANLRELAAMLERELRSKRGRALLAGADNEDLIAMHVHLVDAMLRVSLANAPLNPLRIRGLATGAAAARRERRERRERRAKGGGRAGAGDA